LTRKLNIVLLALLILVGGPFYWLLLNATTMDDARHPVTIAQLRRLAGTAPDQAPIDVRYETLGQRRVTSDLLVAGSGLRPVPFVIRAYELILPDGGVITIDRGLNRKAAQAERLANFDPRAQGSVEAALAVARISLTLAPGVQHSGEATVPGNDASGLSLHAVAPGVVVISTADVGPGERMVYVRLADETELLFAGDIAPLRDAWSQVRPPARLTTSHWAPRDREALARWLRTVAAIKAAAPQLQIVAGHDAQVPSALTRGFIAPADQSRRPGR
jgi:hypothetical protein